MWPFGALVHIVYALAYSYARCVNYFHITKRKKKKKKRRRRKVVINLRIERLYIHVKQEIHILW